MINFQVLRKFHVSFNNFDYKQMFDGMDDKEACGDLFDYGVNDDHI